MTDRICVRGCTQRDVHYAVCDRHGPDYDGDDVCTGCAPRECRDGSLICDRCFGRMRALLADIFDLIGRLRSLADPSKATPTDEERFASNYAGSKAPAGVDLLDALHSVEEVASVWEVWGRDLARVQNDLAAVEYFGAHVLDRHRAVDGIREAWSVQDAIDKWGIERQDARRPYEDDEDESAEQVVFPVREWHDRLLTRAEAISVAGSARTLRRWEKDGLVGTEGRMVIAGVVTDWYRYSDLTAVREAMAANAKRTRFKTDEEKDE